MTLAKPKLALLQVARSRLGLSEDDYRAELERFGGSRSARELDNRGFDAVMDRFRALGFTSTARKRSYGERAGMASPKQVALIRALWREAVEDSTESALGHWLEHFHHVSSLRFLEAGRAGDVITGLKAMVARRKTVPAVLVILGKPALDRSPRCPRLDGGGGDCRRALRRPGFKTRGRLDYRPSRRDGGVLASGGLAVMLRLGGGPTQGAT